MSNSTPTGRQIARAFIVATGLYLSGWFFLILISTPILLQLAEEHTELGTALVVGFAGVLSFVLTVCRLDKIIK